MQQSWCFDKLLWPGWGIATLRDPARSSVKGETKIPFLCLIFNLLISAFYWLNLMRHQLTKKNRDFTMSTIIRECWRMSLRVTLKLRQEVNGRHIGITIYFSLLVCWFLPGFKTFSVPPGVFQFAWNSSLPPNFPLFIEIPRPFHHISV